MNLNKKIKVIIVEDSRVKQEILINILNSDPDIEVIAAASSGKTAIRYIKDRKPDIVTMDINMPGMDGFETTKKILRECPLPIIIISSIRSIHNKRKVAEAMMESGALYFLDTPPGPWHPDFESVSKNIIRKVKSMSQVKVFTRRKPCSIKTKVVKEKVNPPILSKTAIIAIGVSTGGPPLLNEILRRLPENFNFPIVIVQHINDNFDSFLAEYLNRDCKVTVKLAKNAEPLKSKTVYIAPGKHHLTISSSYKVALIKNNSDHIIPSADALFNSVANIYGSSGVGILLTGMGKDGAKGLKKMKDKGAVTIIQNKASSVVYSMPYEAKKINAEKFIMSPEEIIQYLLDINTKYEIIYLKQSSNL